MTTHRQSVRKTTAALRVAGRQERSPQEQIARLDQRLGAGIGAKRERERLGYAQLAQHETTEDRVMRQAIARRKRGGGDRTCVFA